MKKILTSIVAALAVVLGAALPSHAQEHPPPSRGEALAYLTSQGFVAYSSVRDIRTSNRVFEVGGEEGNFVVRNEDGHLNEGAKLAITGTVSAANHYLLYRRGHPRLAAAVNFTMGTLYLIASFHNERVYERLRPPEELNPMIRRRRGVPLLALRF